MVQGGVQVNSLAQQVPLYRLVRKAKGEIVQPLSSIQRRTVA